MSVEADKLKHTGFTNGAKICHFHVSPPAGVTALVRQFYMLAQW